MTRSDALHTLRSFAYDGGATAKLAGSGVAVVVAAVWQALTSTLAVVVMALWVVDALMGVLRSIHIDGIEAFDKDRFGRTWIKGGAMCVVIILLALVDLLLVEAGVPGEWNPAITGGLTSLAVSFGSSASRNAAHFWPGLGEGIRGLLDRISGADVRQDRREEDRAT